MAPFCFLCILQGSVDSHASLCALECACDGPGGPRSNLTLISFERGLMLRGQVTKRHEPAAGVTERISLLARHNRICLLCGRKTRPTAACERLYLYVRPTTLGFVLHQLQYMKKNVRVCVCGFLRSVLCSCRKFCLCWSELQCLHSPSKATV